MAILKNKNIYIVMTGARKCTLIPALISELLAEGAKTYTFTTEMANRFINCSDMNIPGNIMAEDYSKDGQSLPLEDLLLVAPCTFNTLNKIAVGITDNYPTSIIASAIGKRKKVVLAPAMNQSLWEHPIIIQSLDRVKGWGCRIAWPEITLDKVTMAPIEKIADTIYYNLIKIKFPNTQLKTDSNYDKIVEEHYLELKSLGEFLSYRSLTQDTAGCIGKKLAEGILISASGCQIGDLKREDLTLVREIKDSNVHWEGHKTPSSETPLVFEALQNKNSRNFAVHSHCAKITYNPKMEKYCSKEYVRYGTFNEYQKIRGILERNEDFAILRLHGEFCLGANVQDIKNKLEKILGEI